MTDKPNPLLESIVNSYMRGFHEAASGQRGRRHSKPSSSYGRGYDAGKAALDIAKHQANKYAEAFLADSPIFEAVREKLRNDAEDYRRNGSSADSESRYAAKLLDMLEPDDKT